MALSTTPLKSVIGSLSVPSVWIVAVIFFPLTSSFKLFTCILNMLDIQPTNSMLLEFTSFSDRRMESEYMRPVPPSMDRFNSGKCRSIYFAFPVPI